MRRVPSRVAAAGLSCAIFASCATAFSVVRPVTRNPVTTSAILLEATIPSRHDDYSHFDNDKLLPMLGDDDNGDNQLKLQMTRISMMFYIASMCLALPVSLAPLWVLRQLGLVEKCRSEDLSLRIAEFCARNLLRIMPFLDLEVISSARDDETNPEPSIWVANHVSPLDTFLFLATDVDLRGPKKRPLKTIYWKGLEENPVTKLLFSMAGFIPVDMAANGSGNPNEYDARSFKQLLRGSSQAFADGFDIFILPEGQLNPNPSCGLLPVFSGAYNLAERSHRPIRFVGVYGTQQLWDADMNINVRSNVVKLRCYPDTAKSHFESAEDFIGTMNAVLGYFGAHGEDTPDLDQWLFRERADAGEQ